MRWHVLDAVFKRNFGAYFSSPTGYVFICVFVLLGSLAAFWSPGFFAANLANLDELNRWMPAILLVFVPAITMSVWADERRQGTDELLLALPVSDWEVVFGKYLAAVGIFTVSLVFSCVCNLVFLCLLGDPDPGLFLATYLGYWFTGLAMLAIGMVASFLTGNLTVAFILGVLFNAPLALADRAGTAMGARLAGVVRSWSLAEHFTDFGRGLVSLPAIAYFLGIVAVCLYLCMVLVGRRHWTAGQGGAWLGLHFIARVAGLVMVAVGVVLLLGSIDQRVGLRADLSAERIGSLADDTVNVLGALETKRPIEITAFVSPSVPEAYVQTRLNLLSILRQFERLGRGKVSVEVVPAEPNTAAADRAERQYGIEPRYVVDRVRGDYRQDRIFLGCAITSGLEKESVPFFDVGTPVEYELIRAVYKVSRSERKRIGVLSTGAQLFGGFDMMSGQMRPRQPILEELEKHYDVVQVDASQPITERFDALLAIQPSTLFPGAMENFVAAIEAGQPVAIFEDPFPVPIGRYRVPGTGDPPIGAPKGDLDLLWRALGVRLGSREAAGPYVVCQNHHPHPRMPDMTGFVYIDASLEAGDESENPPGFDQDDRMTCGLQEVLFPFPGGIDPPEAGDVTFTPLIRTAAPKTGTIEVADLDRDGEEAGLRVREADESIVLAALVERPLKPAATGERPETAGGEQGAAGKLRAVIVADIDLMLPYFLFLRNRPDEELRVDFDNIEFILNVLDDLTGDDRLLNVRNRRPRHRTLRGIDEAVAQARQETENARATFIAEYEEEQGKAEKVVQAEIEEFQEKIAAMQRQEDMDPEVWKQAFQQAAIRESLERRKLAAKTAEWGRARDAAIAGVNRKLEETIRSEQDWLKWMALLLPPIPPLVVAFFVFFSRRAREREGVARGRLKWSGDPS